MLLATSAGPTCSSASHLWRHEPGGVSRRPWLEGAGPPPWNSHAAAGCAPRSDAPAAMDATRKAAEQATTRGHRMVHAAKRLRRVRRRAPCRCTVLRGARVVTSCNRARDVSALAEGAALICRVSGFSAIVHESCHSRRLLVVLINIYMMSFNEVDLNSAELKGHPRARAAFGGAAGGAWTRVGAAKRARRARARIPLVALPPSAHAV